MDRSDSNNNNNKDELRELYTFIALCHLRFHYKYTTRPPTKLLPPPTSLSITNPHQAGLNGMEVKESSQRLKAGW